MSEITHDFQLDSVEKMVIHGLIFRESYARRVLPFIEVDYFNSKAEKTIFQIITKYYEDYDSPPTPEIVAIHVRESKKLNEDEANDAIEYLSEINVEETTYNEEWLVNRTEDFCKDRALYNSVFQSINIINGEDRKYDRGAIPEILQQALSVSFNTDVGHDYLADAEKRFQFYQHLENRVPTDIESLNKITRGGFPDKTLTMFVAGTNVGKTMAMCHLAASNLSLGYNVLYVTMEIAEERIAERIDANLLDIPMHDLEEIPKNVYDRKMAKLRQNVKGKLKIKEYPTAGAGVNHFKSLLNELKIKQSFVPDIIYVDYLNIMNSSRMKMGGSINSYSYIKAIAEELRGLAVEQNLPIVSATQTNKDGLNDMDFDMTNTSESHGTNMTADAIYGLMTNEELQEKGMMLLKQLKTRYVDINYMRKFFIGVEYHKMRLYEMENPLDGITQTHNDQNNSTQSNSGHRTTRKRPSFDDFDFED